MIDGFTGVGEVTGLFTCKGMGLQFLSQDFFIMDGRGVVGDMNIGYWVTRALL